MRVRKICTAVVGLALLAGFSVVTAAAAPAATIRANIAMTQRIEHGARQGSTGVQARKAPQPALPIHRAAIAATKTAPRWPVN